MPRIRFQPRQLDDRMLWIRWITLGIAVACFSWGGWLWLERTLHQSSADVLFADVLFQDEQHAQVRPATGQVAPQKVKIVPPRMPLAKLEIPRLGVSGYVQEGFDATTLRQAIGHAPSSAKPGERGNIVLAGHRDTFFAGLSEVQTGDVVRLRARSGKMLLYQVSQVFVVDPADFWVMNPTPGRDQLTLITCYPFSFIGSAPSRLVVLAQPLIAVTT